MKKNSINLGINETLIVKIALKTDYQVQGELILKKKELPLLKLSYQDYNSYGIKEFIEKNVKFIKCKSNLDEFILLENNFSGEFIYPKYILKNAHFNNYNDIKFNGLHIYLTNLSHWFETNDFNIKDSKIEKDITFKIIESDPISINNKKIKISNYYNCDIKKDENNNRKTIVDEYPTVSVDCVDGYLSINDVGKLSHDFRNIFTFLTGHCTFPLYIWATVNVSKRSSKKWIPVYILNNFNSDERFITRHGNLISYKYLCDNDKWSTIFTNYFENKEKKERFQSLWSRLIGMLNYNDIFDFEILGFVSILNKYVEYYASKHKNKLLSPKRFKELKDKVINETDLNKLNIPKKNEQFFYNKVIDSINRIPNSPTTTFIEKFNLLLSDLNNDIIRFINMTDENIKILKGLRDDVAHANEIKNATSDYTYIFLLKDKLILLIYYLIYKDLGIDDKDVINNFYKSFHELIRNPELNRKFLDLAAGEIPFFNVDQETYENVKSSSLYYISLEINEKEKKYKFNKDINDKILKIWSIGKSEFSKMVDFVISFYHKNKVVDAKYLNAAYIQYNDNSIKIHGLCMVLIT